MQNHQWLKPPGSSINRVIELLKLPPRIVCVSLFVNLEGNSMFVSLRVLLYESIVKVIKLLLDNVIFLLSDSNFLITMIVYYHLVVWP